MKRLLIWTIACVCLLGFLPTATAQDDSSAGRAARRAEERAQREQERSEREQARAEARARREQERQDRRLDRRSDTDEGAHILLGQDYELAEGSTTTEKVVVLGGTATIDGHAEDDVVVVGGSIRLGPKSIVDGDVSVIGGELDRDPAAQVSGEVHVAHVSMPWFRGWNWPGVVPTIGRVWWEAAAFAFTIGRFVLVLLISTILVAAFPRWSTGIAARLVAGPGVSAISGFAAEIFFGPALVFLAVAFIITIVGIPLLLTLPVLVAGFALTWVAGYAAVAGLLGARLRGSDWYVQGIRPLDVFIGSCILSSITIAGQVLMLSPGWLAPFALGVRGTGWVLEYIAWTVGLGAALLAWIRPIGFSPRSVPPAVPPLPSPSPTVL
jgi:hypothetical protein